MTEARIERNDLLLNILFVLMVAVTLLVRAVIFFQYNCVFVDGDQPISWLAARDYANGIFSEPRFYAQDYNTHMESLFAVPLLWAGIQVFYALPIATHFIFLFPYLFTAFYLFYRRMKLHAIVLLGISLLMPVSFDLMNGLSRGFVTGLFFGSFLVISVLAPQRLGFLSINSVLAVVGFFVSPMSALVTVPFLFYVFLFNYKIRSYYLVTGACLLLAIPLHLLFDRFYIEHPDYVLVDLQRTFSTTALWTNISHLDLTFSQITFLAEGKSVLLLIAWLLLLVYLFPRNKKAFGAFLVFLSIVIASFTMDKSTEGTNWVFGARSRLYLPAPFVMGLFLVTVPLKAGRSAWAMIFPLLFAAYKMLNHGNLLAHHFEERNFQGVNLVRLSATLDAISHYKSSCEKTDSDFMLISGRFWGSSHLAYGGPAIFADHPPTQLTNAERRYLVRNQNKDRVIDKFLFITIRYNFHEKVSRCRDFKLTMLDHYGMYLVTDNRLKVGDFVSLVNNLEEKEICLCP